MCQENITDEETNFNLVKKAIKSFSLEEYHLQASSIDSNRLKLQELLVQSMIRNFYQIGVAVLSTIILYLYIIFLFLPQNRQYSKQSIPIRYLRLNIFYYM